MHVVPTVTLDSDVLDLGIYSPGLAGALAGVKGRHIGQWARHHLVRPTIYEGRPANRYSYFDVAEAIVVRWMLNRGIAHGDISYAVREAREKFPEWPLLSAPLAIGQMSGDDTPRLVKEDEEGVFMDASRRGRARPGQVIIRPLLLDQAREMLARGGWLAYERGLKRIEVTPLKLGGAPSLRGRRWTVEQVARIADDDAGRAVLRETYGLSAEEIDESVSWMDAALAIGR